MRRMYSLSRGWYTYRTLSVSTNVCCFPLPMSLGKVDKSPSIRARVISTNCLDTRAVGMLHLQSLCIKWPILYPYLSPAWCTLQLPATPVGDRVVMGII
jgi:hypothetical protein